MLHLPEADGPQKMVTAAHALSSHACGYNYVLAMFACAKRTALCLFLFMSWPGNYNYIVQYTSFWIHVFKHACVCAGGFKRSPRFVEGIYWEAGLFLRTPLTKGCAGAIENASPPGRQ